MDGLDVLLVMGVLLFAIWGVIATVADFRHFSTIEQQCRESGYVQNQKVRLICSVEQR
jgi:hypothetical protein